MTAAVTDGHAWLMDHSISYRLHHSGLTIDEEPYSLDDYPYVVEMLDETVPRTTILKGAQLGITVMAVAKCTEKARTERLRSILYVFPSDRQVIEFSKARMEPWLGNDLYAGATGSSALRRINGTNLYFRAGGVQGTAANQSLANVKSIPADGLVEDESDEIEPGRREALRHRLDSSKDPWHIDLSTPTLPGYGVSLDFDQSDGRQGFWKCPKCAQWTCLEDHFPDCIATPNEGDPFYLCMSCREPLSRRHAQWEWVPARPSVTDWRGYALSQMCSLRKGAGYVLDEFERAENSTRAGAVREFYNQVLGRPYAEVDDQLTDAQLNECVDADRVASSQANGPCAMGVDPGAREMHYVIGDRISSTDSRVLKWGTVSGFEDIGQLAKKFNVQCGVMDQGAESRKVREFCDAHPAWFGCHYSDNKQGPYDWNIRQQHVTVNRTEALDAGHLAVIKRRVQFPAKDETYHKTIAPQMKNMARIQLRNDQSGAIKHRWVVTGGMKNDHIFHAHAYFQMAIERVGLSEQVVRATRPRRSTRKRSFMAS